MKFEKISKEEWEKLSQSEKERLTLEFNKSVEQRKMITLILTRGIAIFCILGLFFIGIIQIVTYSDNQKIIEKYGSNGYCYLCGEYSVKQCDCIYFREGQVPEDMNNYSLQVAEENVQQCDSEKVNGNYQYPILNITTNFTK
jgi:hypothetical protein